MVFDLLVEATPDAISRSVIVRCVDGAVRVGAAIAEVRSTEGATIETRLQVESIERYEGVMVDELERAHVGRLHLRGEIPAAILSGWRLIG